MSDVLHFEQVSVLRDGATLIDRLDWDVAEGERWVVLGPNGAGKTTLLQLASANLHPSRGTAAVLGETLGAVDVFELRPRIGLSSAALAERLPARETVRDVVLTASYAVVGRWREALRADRRRAGRRAAGRARVWRSWPSGGSGRCPRASASGCRSPGR